MNKIDHIDVYEFKSPKRYTIALVYYHSGSIKRLCAGQKIPATVQRFIDGCCMTLAEDNITHKIYRLR